MPRQQYTYSLDFIDEAEFALLFLKSGRKRIRGSQRNDVHEDLYRILEQFHNSGKAVAEIKTDAKPSSVRTMMGKTMQQFPEVCENVHVTQVGDRMFLMDHSKWFDD